MHLLLGVDISATDLDFAEELLSEFYMLVPELYPEEMLTANLHCVIHLCSYVRLLGPLWAYSTFGFENMNGHITKHRHGNRNFLPSISRAISMQYTIPKFRNKFVKSENSRTLTFLGSGDKCIPTGPLGRITQQSLLKDEVDAVVKAGFFVPNTNNVTTCVSFAFNATSYRARKGGIRRLRDSSICEFKNEDRTMLGSIRKFCILTEGPIIILDVFTKLPESILDTSIVSSTECSHGMSTLH